MYHWTTTLNVQYSQEKRSFKQVFVNSHSSQFVLLYAINNLFFFWSSSPLLLLLFRFVSTISFTRLLCNYNLKCLSRSSKLLYNRENIIKMSITLFSRTVFSNCMLFVTYSHIYLLE